MPRSDKPLDLDAVQAFVLATDLASFTRAAEALGSAQAVISLRIKRLETRLGYRLLERTPRSVRVSREGASFLPRARALLAAHAVAIAGPTEQRELSLGISEHAVGNDLTRVLARLTIDDPQLRLTLRLGFSRPLLDDFDAGAFDAVIVRREAGRRDGELILTDSFGWFAAADYRPGAEPLRLITLSPACGVRATAIKRLDAARKPWREVFVGGGIMAVTAAVTAGLGVSPLAQRIAPRDSVDIGALLSLPRLAPSKVVMHSRSGDAAGLRALRVLAAALRANAQS